MKKINSISDSDSDSDYKSVDDAFVKEFVSALQKEPDITNISVKKYESKKYMVTQNIFLMKKD